MSEIPENSDDGRAAADDYRTQRQTADARASGFEGLTRDEFLAWIDKNTPRLEEIARQNGAKEEEVQGLVEEYIRLLRDVPALGEFDDLNVTLILTGIIQRIEAVCSSGAIPVREGVAYGVTPKLGLEASQLAVLGTGASIITVSQSFPIFCNMVSKAVALSMVCGNDHVSWDPTAVRDHLAARPDIRAYWTQLFTSYALSGWPSDKPSPSLEPLQQVTRIQVLQALELFAIAHEYGHHVLRHGDAESSEDDRDHYCDEHEADIFGRLVCLHEGLNSEPPNLFAASGAGAVLILTTLEIVRRTRALLETGKPTQPPRNTHPPLPERIEVIAGADETAHEADRPIFADMRSCAQTLLDIVWDAIEPVMQEMHEKGIRPQPAESEVGGWLPKPPQN